MKATFLIIRVFFVTSLAESYPYRIPYLRSTPTPRVSNHALVDENVRALRAAGSVENEIRDNIDAKVQQEEEEEEEETRIEEEVDVAIIGAGIGGLCAGAILNTLYDKKVGIYESHYLPGGCAHAFDRVSISDDDDAKQKKEKTAFTFDSGPTIVLGCSRAPFNPLVQVMNAVGLGDCVEWIRYDGWGMIEHAKEEEDGSPLRWKLRLGPDAFEDGPLKKFGGPNAWKEFRELCEVTKPLVGGAVDIPAMAMRPGSSSIVPLLRYFSSLVGLIKQGEVVTGTFAPFMDGPLYTVTDQWLRDWLDALAFSLSGLPANRTAAAAMAYILYDMHREGAALDYPRGGLGSVVDALVKGVEQGPNRSRLHLRQKVRSIDTTPDGSRVIGLSLTSGKRIKTKDGVICNAPIWLLRELVPNEAARNILRGIIHPNGKPSGAATSADGRSDLLTKCDTAEMTRSFLHLHLALDATGLDLNAMEAHYTVMDQGLANDPCGELNMIAVSNPCVIDDTLAPPGYIVLHAYAAGNEPYHIWEGLSRSSKEYKQLKSTRSQVLWRAVESIIPDVRDRVVLDLLGSPITHERFLTRPKGTYGVVTEDLLKDGSTPIHGLVLAGDGIFPGIGIPAVALSGASAANGMVGVWKHWRKMDFLKDRNLM